MVNALATVTVPPLQMVTFVARSAVAQFEKIRVAFEIANEPSVAVSFVSRTYPLVISAVSPAPG